MQSFKDALANGRAVTLSAVAGLGNSTPIRLDNPSTAEMDENTYRVGQHVYAVTEVLTDASGTPTGSATSQGQFRSFIR